MARNAIGMMTANANLVGESPCDAAGVCVGVGVFVTGAVVDVKIRVGRGRLREVVGTDPVSVTRPLGTAVSVEEMATCKEVAVGRA